MLQKYLKKEKNKNTIWQIKKQNKNTNLKCDSSRTYKLLQQQHKQQSKTGNRNIKISIYLKQQPNNHTKWCVMAFQGSKYLVIVRDKQAKQTKNIYCIKSRLCNIV